MDLSKHMLFQSVRLVGAVGIEPTTLFLTSYMEKIWRASGTAGGWECENRSLLRKRRRRGQKSVLTELDWANPGQSSEIAGRRLRRKDCRDTMGVSS